MGAEGLMTAVRLEAKPSCWGVSYIPTEEGFPFRQFVFDDSLKEGLSYAYRMSSNVLASLTKTPVAFENTQVVTTEAPPTIAMHLWGGVTMTHSSSWLLNLTHSAVDL